MQTDSLHHQLKKENPTRMRTAYLENSFRFIHQKKHDSGLLLIFKRFLGQAKDDSFPKTIHISFLIFKT